MHGARVGDEVEARPWIPGEEFRRQQVSLQPVAARAGEDDVPRNVSAAVRQRMHVVERREIEVEGRGAVDATSSAIAHRGAFDRALLVAGRDVLATAGRSRESGKGNVKMPTSGHVTSLKRQNPATGSGPVAGFAPIREVADPTETVALAPLSWWRRSTYCAMSDEWAIGLRWGRASIVFRARHTNAHGGKTAQEANETNSSPALISVGGRLWEKLSMCSFASVDHTRRC